MTDLETWAQARGLDLAAHLAVIDAAAVRGRTADLEKAHKKWLKQLDREIADAALLPGHDGQSSGAS